MDQIKDLDQADGNGHSHKETDVANNRQLVQCFKEMKLP